MKPKPLPVRGQRACMHGKLLDDGRVWCTIFNGICSVDKECSHYKPNIMHWMSDSEKD